MSTVFHTSTGTEPPWVFLGVSPSLPRVIDLGGWVRGNDTLATWNSREWEGNLLWKTRDNRGEGPVMVCGGMGFHAWYLEALLAVLLRRLLREDHN